MKTSVEKAKLSNASRSGAEARPDFVAFIGPAEAVPLLQGPVVAVSAPIPKLGADQSGTATADPSLTTPELKDVRGPVRSEFVTFSNAAKIRVANEVTYSEEKAEKLKKSQTLRMTALQWSEADAFVRSFGPAEAVPWLQNPFD